MLKGMDILKFIYQNIEHFKGSVSSVNKLLALANGGALKRYTIHAIFNDYNMPCDRNISARSACFFEYSRSVDIKLLLFASAFDACINAGCIAVRRSQIM